MKQTILLAAVVLLSMTGRGQSKQDSLIADETWSIDLKASFKVLTFNKDIYDTLISAKENVIREVMISYGNPRRYSVYFRPEYKSEVLAFFDKLNKKR